MSNRFYNNVRNFAKTGNIGPFPILNVVEASVISLGEVLIILKTPFAFKTKIIIGMILLFPTLLICLNGIMDCTLTELLIKFVRFMLSKRKYTDPSPAEAGAREREILQVKKKQLRQIQIEENKKRREEEKRQKAELKKQKLESEIAAKEFTGEEAGHADGKSDGE